MPEQLAKEYFNYLGLGSWKIKKQSPLKGWS